MSKPVPITMDEDEALELLRGSAALEIDLVDALVEREPSPEELAPDEPSRCKYLSKKCLRQRATKAKGELHKLCTFHRAKAILNQRRLERRKRGRGGAADAESDDPVSEAPVVVKRRPAPPRRRSTSAIQAGDRQEAARKRKRSRSAAAASLVMLPAIDVGDDVAAVAIAKTEPATRLPSPRDVQDLEPFRTPATLFPEDLEAVRGLVDVDVVEWPFAWDFHF